MITLRNRIWLTHRHRLEYDFCPLCNNPLKWIYDGSVWVPCDREPILVYPGKGNQKAVIRRKLVQDCCLYADRVLAGIRPVEGHRPHVYTCTELHGGRYAE